MHFKCNLRAYSETLQFLKVEEIPQKHVQEWKKSEYLRFTSSETINDLTECWK